MILMMEAESGIEPLSTALQSVGVKLFLHRISLLQSSSGNPLT